MGCQCDKQFKPEKEIVSDILTPNVFGTNEQEPPFEPEDKPEKSKGGFYRVVEYRQGGSGFSGFGGFEDAFADFGNDFPTGRVIKQEIITRNDYNQPQSTSTKDISEEVLKLINEKRKLHGVQPLLLNQTINQLAIDSASSNAQKDDLDYANKNYKGEPLGECLFACSGNPSASKIVNEWYNESKNYNYNRGNEDAGNFTQMVWKSSKEFGFGMKKSRSGMNYIIGLFYPAGNYCGEHKTNVFPAGTPVQENNASKKQSNRQEYQNDDEDDFEKQKRKIFENLANNSGKQQIYYYDSRDNKKNNNNYYYDNYDNGKQQQFVDDEEPEYNNASGSSGDFVQDSLQAHNKYRTKHHAPPLKINSELNRIAQQYANYLAQNDCFQHSDNEYRGESLGENLYMCYGTKITGKAMTDAWYNEIKQYNFNASTFTSGTGHFTQVVWKDSKEVGFAYAQSRSGNYYGVANYYPADSTINPIMLDPLSNGGKLNQNNTNLQHKTTINDSDDDGSHHSCKIDVAKLNENMKNYQSKDTFHKQDHPNSEHVRTDSQCNSYMNDDEGIKKSPLQEFDSPTRDFDLEFPEFHEIDKIYKTKQQASEEEQTTNSPKTSNYLNNIEVDMKTDKNIDASSLLKLLKDKKIPQIVSLIEFELTVLLYKHKDEVYQGKYHPMNTDERDVFIKRTKLLTKADLNASIREVTILLKLLYLHDNDKQTNEYINPLLFYYYDSDSKYFYLFFEYYELTVFSYIKETETDDLSPDVIPKGKLMLLHKFLLFFVMLHSNGILHRDFCLEYFTYYNNYPKTFDFANAYQIDLTLGDPDNNNNNNNKQEGGNMFLKRNVTHFQDSNLISYIPKIQTDLENSGLFITPKFVCPELTAIDPAFGYGQDIWALACVAIEIFITYRVYQEEMISRLLNRIFRGDDYLKEPSFSSNTKDFNNNIGNTKGIGSGYGNHTTNINGGDNNNNNYDRDGGGYTAEKAKLELRYAIPKIPKVIAKEIAQVIATCFYVQPINRPNIVTLIDKFNSVFKAHGIEQIDLSTNEHNSIENLFLVNELIYKNMYNAKTIENRWKECPYHKGSYKNYYCETCNDFFCDNSISMAHNEHLYEVLCGKHKIENVDKDGNIVQEELDVEELSFEKTMLKGYQVDLEKMEMEKNFKIIEEFSQSFDCDYAGEKERIKNQYEIIMRKINELETSQLCNLDQAKDKFENSFNKIFNESEKIDEMCASLYSSKNLFFAHLNRFNSSLKYRKVNSLNYPLFRKKFNEFKQCANVLKEKGQKLKKKCEGFQITGKYIFRHELYTDEIYKNLKSLEMRINNEKMKFFDYSDSDSLFLKNELIMIIPLTSCVFSYNKNSYKKFKVDFEKNNVKLNSFLPGCATLHQDNFFYVTGGEIKDEATSNFIFMNIDEKVIHERIEMNYPRRFHTMLSVCTKDQKFIVVIGGWDSNEVEYINSQDPKKWISLPSMHTKRSDPTAYLFDNKYIYVFGGWDYSQKRCAPDIERYLILNNYDDDVLLTNSQWENVKIKGETISLQKYNMGLIALNDEKTENSEKIILVGGFDESYDYSQSVIKIEIMTKDNSIFVNKDIKGLPTGGESSFWYEKHFHIMNNDLDGETIAVNFNCFNNIYVYTFRTSEFKQYANSTSKN